MLELESKQVKKRAIANSIELAQQFLECYETATIEEKRMFIRAFVKRINVNPIFEEFSIEVLTYKGNASEQIKDT